MVEEPHFLMCLEWCDLYFNIVFLVLWMGIELVVEVQFSCVTISIWPCQRTFFVG